MTLLYWLAAGMAMLWVGYSAVRLRRDRSALAALSALCMLTASAAMTVTAMCPDVLRAWPAEPTATWLGISLGLAAVWAFLGTLDLITGDTAHPVGLMAVPAAAAVSFGLFQIAAQHGGLAGQGSRAAWGNPALISQLGLLACFCPALARISVTAWRFSGRVRMSHIRLGLRAVAGGAAGELGLVLARAGAVSARASGVLVPGWAATGVAVAMPLAAVVVVAGTTSSAWVPPLTGLLRHAWLVYAYWQLRPLRVMVGRAIPEVGLPPDGGLRWNMRYRLLRRVIEIRDAQVVLRPYADAGTGSRAGAAARSAGLSPARCAAVAEAAVLMNGLRARLRGDPPRCDDRAAVPGGASPGTGMSGNDLRSEAAALLLVSRAIRSPVIRRAEGRSRGRSPLAGRADGHAARRR